MTTQFDCALDDILLSSLDDHICVLDIKENTPKLRTTALSMHPDGQHLLRQTRESLTVQVHFAIHEEDPTRRREAMQVVCAWAAKGGLLTTSDRPGQQLTVICTETPAMSADDWTEALTLSFTTAHSPYWEDAEPTQVTGSGAMMLTVPGTADFAPVDAAIFNTGTAPVTHLSLHCGSTYIIFEDIFLPVGGQFFLQNTKGVLFAHINGESVLRHRTSGSADLLLAPCGQECLVSALALQPLQATFTARGRYV